MSTVTTGEAQHIAAELAAQGERVHAHEVEALAADRDAQQRRAEEAEGFVTALRAPWHPLRYLDPTSPFAFLRMDEEAAKDAKMPTAEIIAAWQAAQASQGEGSGG